MSDDELLRSVSTEASRLANDLTTPLRRIRLRSGSAMVDVEWSDGPPAAAAGDDHATDHEPAADGDELVVNSPMVGTFYHAPTPGEPPFVSVGGIVEKDTVIGIVEAMKLMNRITADQDGVVREVLVANGGSVEFGQPLVSLDPVPDLAWRDR
ncbi:MAG TPA: acetyl-CoA carboxylase biotin carboxyl carrier protein [Pseudonocardiaceae bacterium]